MNHVIVCGRYGCGDVKAAMGHDSHGLIDHWLHTLKKTQQYDGQQFGKFRNGIVGRPPQAAVAQHDMS